MATATLGLAAAGAAFAQSAERRVDNDRNSTKTAEVPRCARSLGTLTIADGEGRGWTQYNWGRPRPWSFTLYEIRHRLSISPVPGRIP
jgi:hypothetical protein